MPKTVQDFDGRLGDLLQLQEPSHQLMTEEQQELLVIGRRQGAESTVGQKNAIGDDGVDMGVPVGPLVAVGLNKLGFGQTPKFMM